MFLALVIFHGQIPKALSEFGYKKDQNEMPSPTHIKKMQFHFGHACFASNLIRFVYVS